MTRVKLEAYSTNPPRAARQGWDIRGYIKRHGDWIGPDSETVHRYRTLPNAVKETLRLALLAQKEVAYHPFIVRDEKNRVAGLATVHTGRGVQHPELPHPTTGADLDYNLTENATDEQHLATVHELLRTTGALALGDAIRLKQAEDPTGDGVVDWDEVRHAGREATAFAVVPTQHMENRLRGFELASEAGLMQRIEEPASLTVPEEYAHQYIDFAKGGQQVQVYYAAEMPLSQYR